MDKFIMLIVILPLTSGVMYILWNLFRKDITC